MKKISGRQLIVFYIIYTFAVKFLMLPHFLSMDAGRDAWLGALLGSVLELALLFIILKAITINQDTDIYKTLRGRVTDAGARIVLFVMLLFFMVQTLITVKHTGYMLSQALYEELDFITFAIPMLILGIFFCYTKTRAVFRSGELTYFLIIIALGLALLPSLDKIDAAEILPVLDAGFGPVAGGVYNNLVYFECSAVMLMFMGDVQIKKNFTRNFMITASLCALVFVLFVALYSTIFGPLTEARQLAIVNITQVSSYISQNGRLEWLMVCVWLVMLLMRFGVTFYCCFAAIRYITAGSKVSKWQPAGIAFPLAVVFYIIHAVLVVSITDLSNFITALRPATAAFYIAVPVLFLTLALCGRKKDNPVPQNALTKTRTNPKGGGKHV
jgi:hypothetical protein